MSTGQVEKNPEGESEKQTHSHGCVHEQDHAVFPDDEHWDNLIGTSFVSVVRIFPPWV